MCYLRRMKLSVRDIHKSYGSMEVLRGISVDVAESAVTAIVGPSGAGKSTLLHIMGTLDRPNSGSVLIDGVDVTSLRDKALSRLRNTALGFVFQNHRLLPEFSIIENVAMPCLVGGLGRREAMERARRWLERLGLAERLDHRPSELSGGECQRAAVARALVNDAPLLLADEPSGSLDSENRRQMHRLFFDLRDTYGTTVVIVTHDGQLAEDADHVLHIVDGRLVREQAPATDNEAEQNNSEADARLNPATDLSV